MRLFTNTTTMRERSRCASRQPNYNYLSVDADSDLGSQKTNTARALRGYLSHESTHSHSRKYRAGIVFLFEKCTT